ncbi:hypothetical protein RUND412_006233 [Rhizina undulata]
MPFQLTEGSPVHDAGALYHAGRGGAGNYRRLSPETFSKSSKSSTTKHVSSLPPVSNFYFNGRGGIGNVKCRGERAMFSFDEELERDRIFHEHQAPVYSIGRGGAGNIVPTESKALSSNDAAAVTSSSPRSISSASSTISASSTRSGFSLRTGADRVWERLSRSRSG